MPSTPITPCASIRLVRGAAWWIQLNVDNDDVDDDADVEYDDANHDTLREPPLSVEPRPLAVECPRRARRQYWPGIMTSGGGRAVKWTHCTQ